MSSSIVKKKVTRRDFLKLSGTATAGAMLGTVVSKKVIAAVNPKTKKQYAMAIDMDKCIGCHTCSVSCKAEYNVPLGVWRSWVIAKEKGAYPDTKRYFLPKLCNHCENAPCVKVCPSGASHYGEDGMVLIDKEKCVGCKLCVNACPYKMRFTHPIEKVASKCDFCKNRIDGGVVPACVNACVSKARVFGDINDANSEISELIAEKPVQVLKPELGTDPHNFYINSEDLLVRGGDKE